MTLRDPETREAYAIVRADKARQRKERKEAARQHIRAIVATKAPGQRQPRERDNAFLAAVRRLPCIAGLVTGQCSGPVQAAHVRYSDARFGRVNSGMQAKPDDKWALPLCEGHHIHDQHTRNERQFWHDLNIEPGEVCPSLYASFLAGGDMAFVVQQYRPAVRAKKPEDGRLTGSRDALESLSDLHPLAGGARP